MGIETGGDGWGVSVLPWFPAPEDLDREELEKFGRILDRRPRSLRGDTVCTALAAQMLRVRQRNGKVAPLRANPVQKEFELKRGPRNIVLKARQMGLTTWATARFFLKTITQPGTLTLEVAHTREAAEEIFQIVRRFVDCMPEALRKGALKTSRANAHALVFPALDAQYLVVSAGERNAGRGLTVQNLHCSEVARWPGNPAETLAGLEAALAPQAEVILESTPQGIGGCFHEQWQIAAETGTVQHFFPWWMEPRYRRAAVAKKSLTAEERELMDRHGLDLRQIAYRRHMRANFRGLAAQEFAEDSESCFKASGDSVFELTVVEERLLRAPAPVETRHNGALEVWLPPLKDKRYIVSVDPAGGGSEGDYSAAEVIDELSGIQCAEYAAHIGGSELAKVVTDLAREYNGAWLAIERNNHGSGILALVEEVCHYRRIYRQNKKAGWLTSSVNRPCALGRLNAALIEQRDLFQSRKLLAECRSFVRNRDGSTGARSGTHDDRVIAMAIAWEVRAEILPGSRTKAGLESP
ncbi:MAG TPA: terminase [Terracidiphilus sp.]|nr:terminase [Terracidiphilus sp.]